MHHTAFSRHKLVATLTALLLSCLTIVIACDCQPKVMSPQPSDLHVGFDAMNYYEIWHGNLSMVGYPDQTVTEDQWKSLVSKVRADGFSSLTDDQRRTLLQGTIKSYLMEVSDTERTTTTDDGSTARVLETYQKEGDFYVLPEAREESAVGIVTDWPDIVHVDPGAHHDLKFYKHAGQDVVVEDWMETSGIWSCRQLKSSGGTGLAQAYYYDGFRTLASTGIPQGDEVYHGSAAFVIQYPFQSTNVRVWLDRLSLFPIGFSIPAGLAAKGRQLTPAAEVNITKINTSTAPPAPSSSC